MIPLRDVEVTIKGAKSGAGTGRTIHDVEARVDGSGPWRSESAFELDALDASQPDAYGKALGDQLLTPRLQRALDQAGLTRGSSIRFRLVLEGDGTVPHWVRWERVWLDVGGERWRLAAHPRVAFSRYIAVEQPDGEPPDDPFFDLLVAVANPTGLSEARSIKVESELTSFLDEFESGPLAQRMRVTVMPGRTPIGLELRARMTNRGWKLVDGSTTLGRIADEMQRQHHGLHVLAHGEFDPEEGSAQLLLEDEDGSQRLVQDHELQAWITSNLQLVLLQACQTAAPTREDAKPFTALAPRLIRLGVPACVAMQDDIEMRAARTFFSVFYRRLFDDGLVDVAVNAGRQALIERESDGWSIPALFSRLRGGRLWQPDPLRQAILAERRRLPAAESTTWPPQQAIEHTRGLAHYDPLKGGVGPRFDLAERIRACLDAPRAFIVLTGGRGTLKGAQARQLFRQTADSLLSGAADASWPVPVSFRELAAPDVRGVWGALERLWRDQATDEDRERLVGRRFLLIVDADDDVPGPVRQRAIDALLRLREDLVDVRVLMVADEALVPALVRDFPKATLLVVQPLGTANVLTYLDGLNVPAATQLKDLVSERGYGDLASQPRLLQHMLDLQRRGVAMQSRYAILERVADSYLARMDTRKVPRACALDALERIAWEIQNGRGADLSARQLYPLLSASRDRRDFPLNDLTNALVGECRLLVPSDDEGLRFAYPGMQAYFAARYVSSAHDRLHLIENITAWLGRLSRLRRWENTLVLLAGMLPDASHLLRSLLAGSSLMDGEQLFLAVRCFDEAVAARTIKHDLDDVIDQMVDSLVWRSSWYPGRTYTDRWKALDSLSMLAPACGRHLENTRRNGVDKANALTRARTRIIEHMVRLACDPLPRGAAKRNAMEYDWSGIRHAAASGLFRLSKEATEFLQQHRPELTEPLDAWWKLAASRGPICSLLFPADPRFSALASFAIARSADETSRAALLNAYERSAHPDVSWAIVNALASLEAGWVQQHAVEPWIEAVRATGVDARGRRAEHLCYLIQKTCFASARARDFLCDSLHSGTVAAQGRAIRAWSKLEDGEVDEWLRPLCERIVHCDASAIDVSRMKTSAKAVKDPVLQRAALEALRDIGNARSLEVVRAARRRYDRDMDLRSLSFQVAEEMYWRLTGGLQHETCSADAFASERD